MLRKNKLRKNKRKVQEDDLELQITSLADILIIVLVFLLKNYSAGLEAVTDFSLPEGLNLPVAQIGGKSSKGIQVEVMESGIQINGETAAPLVGFRFPEADLNDDLTDNGTSINLIQYLSQALDKKEKNTKVWIVADRRAPYATIQTVLASAALSGYEDFRLAVVKEEE